MYLSADKYISGYDFNGKEDVMQYNAILDITSMRKLASAHSPSATVKVTVAYWRKANAVHQWFVDTTQGGMDECQESYVAQEQLQELSDVCADALLAYHGHANAAPENILPTTSGFFFGSTDYDEGYEYDLKDTIEQLAPLLKLEDNDISFSYHASW